MDGLRIIGQKAKETRKRLGYSNMAVLAKILQISKNDISEIERGIFRGSIINVMKYLNYLGLTLHCVTKGSPTLENLHEYFDDE